MHFKIKPFSVWFTYFWFLLSQLHWRANIINPKSELMPRIFYPHLQFLCLCNPTNIYFTTTALKNNRYLSPHWSIMDMELSHWLIEFLYASNLHNSVMSMDLKEGFYSTTFSTEDYQNIFTYFTYCIKIYIHIHIHYSLSSS